MQFRAILGGRHAAVKRKNWGNTLELFDTVPSGTPSQVDGCVLCDARVLLAFFFLLILLTDF